MIRFILGCLVITVQVILSIILYPIGLLIGLFSKQMSRKYAFIFGKITLTMIRFVCGMKVIEIGKENLDNKNTVLYISNHQSFQDIIVVWPSLPKPTSYMAKESLVKIPVFGAWIKMAGCVGVDRDNPRKAMKSLLNIKSQVDSGNNAYIFPEGTRNKNSDLTELLDFKAGAEKIAQKTDCLIQPIAINHSHIIENNFPHFKKEETIIEYLKPFRYSELTEQNQKDFNNYCRKLISDKLIEFNK